MEQSVVVIKAEQQRADRLAVGPVAKPAHHAICTAVVLHLLQGGALARAIRGVAALGDDAVERWARLFEPLRRLRDRLRGGREPNGGMAGEITSRKLIELLPAR